ncbi:hypothetical protein VKT23_014997 [Stygiomarasmius scandens]|uniref:FAD-binding domain-containing protein n=1 Tax=Marasmiellus scandens TaxID=2682957 RepID=A0ABR1IZ74_9AGAR
MTAPVLIAGAGLSGLVLALSLLRNGVPVRIIEKESKFAIGQRGPGIQPRTLELYKFLGVLPELLSHEECSRLLVLEHWASPQGQEPVATKQIMDEDTTPDRPCNNIVMLGQSAHEGILRSVLKRDYGLDVELGSELRSFEQHDDHVVVRIAKIGIDNTETVEEAKVSYLVGCDGARSAVRRQLGLTFLGESPPSVSLFIGDIHIKGLDNSRMRIWGDYSRRNLVVRPFTTNQGDDRFNFFMGGPEIDITRVSSSRDELIKTFQEVTGRNDLEFGELLWQSQWRPNIRMVNEFGRGRVFVAGDSAHVHSPTGGQGLNSGIQDSINLAWKLSLTFKNLASNSLIETYSQERLPVIAAMLEKTTELYHKTFSPTQKGLAGWQRGYELKQFGVNYRGSPLTLDEKHGELEEPVDHYRAGEDGTVRAGDRAPDAPGLVRKDSVATETTLFDIFNPTRHTVLVFCGATRRKENLIEAIAEFPAGTVQTVFVFPRATPEENIRKPGSGVDYIVVDRDGYAYKHYVVDETDGGIVIVRPDSWIGGLVSGVEGVKKYFGQIFGV